MVNPGRNSLRRISRISSRNRSIPAVSICTTIPSPYRSTISPGRKSPSELTRRQESVRASRTRLRNPAAARIRSSRSARSTATGVQDNTRQMICDSGFTYPAARNSPREEYTSAGWPFSSNSSTRATAPENIQGL